MYRSIQQKQFVKVAEVRENVGESDFQSVLRSRTLIDVLGYIT